MKLDVIIKICALGVLCAVTYVAIGQITGSFSAALRVAGTVMVMTVGISIVSDIISSVLEWEMPSLAQECITLLFRALGICVLCRISSDVCKDCGITSLSLAIESAGKMVLVLMSMPSIANIVEHAQLLIDRV